MNSTFFSTSRSTRFRSIAGLLTPLHFSLAVLLFASIGFGQDSVSESNKTSATLDAGDGTDGDIGAALDSIFDVRRAPKAKSMGLLQGSFLDALSPKQKIQVAFVVDTTESMESQMVAIRSRLPNMVADLGRLVDGKVESAIVSVADVGSEGNPVKVVTPSFVSSDRFVEDDIQIKNQQRSALFFGAN